MEDARSERCAASAGEIPGLDVLPELSGETILLLAAAAAVEEAEEEGVGAVENEDGCGGLTSSPSNAANKSSSSAASILMIVAGAAIAGVVAVAGIVLVTCADGTLPFAASWCERAAVRSLHTRWTERRTLSQSE